jgi:hypothetical protein
MISTGCQKARRPVVSFVEALIDPVGHGQHEVPELSHLRAKGTPGEFVFARWSGYGTGPEGPFEINGVDRIRVRDGKVIENRIISDASIFEHFARYVADRKKGAPSTAA